MDTESTTMCCLLDRKSNSVLMIKRKKNWEGMAFPGGHLENGESITECICREILEETGLKIRSLQYKGNVFFFNTRSFKKRMVWNYFSDDFEGIAKKKCDEGELYWVKLEQLETSSLAEGMELRFPLFFDQGVFELYVEWDEEQGYTDIRKVKIG